MPEWWRGRSEQPACCASNLDRSRRFYCDLLGLAICREFGPPDDPGLVFFFGQGLLEVSGHAAGAAGSLVMTWIQVRDVHPGRARLAAAGPPVVVSQPRSAGVRPRCRSRAPAASGLSWRPLPIMNGSRPSPSRVRKGADNLPMRLSQRARYRRPGESPGPFAGRW